ncbi:hypothetical protein [Dokdonella ginsengisoli]|uniref:Lipoprotein n=1 Tax=Dokdonella ginsengisoli TaxID=363846 RepID=A0ABV9QU73_9GAMM
MLAVVVAGLVSACAQPRGDGPTRFSAAGGCATTPAELPSTTLRTSPEEPLEIAVDGSVSCLRDGRGDPRPALKFDLAGLTLPLEVQITSIAQRSVTFAPTADVLDVDARTIARHPFERFTKRQTDYSLSVFLNAAGQPPAFLLLMPDDAWLGKQNRTISGESYTFVWSTGAVMGTYTGGGERNTVSTFSDVGRIRILVKPYRPATAGR